jgi:integrase
MIPIRVALAERLFMAYQRGSLKKVRRKEGESWVLRYRVANAEGRRVENTLPIGLVRDFPSEGDAWREVDKRSLLVRVNDVSPEARRVKFNQLAEHYLKVDFGEDAVRPKSDTTIPNVERYVRKYLVARFGQQIAEDITPLEIQRWMKSLHSERKLAWTTISKIRGIMRRIYKIGIQHELVTKNPAATVETRSTTSYKAVIVSPAQTLEILNRLTNPLHYALVATCAATALRASEVLAMRWLDIRWDEERIRISKRWAMGADGDTKTRSSDGFVPLHHLLAASLAEWQKLSPYSKERDFVFPSLRMDGKIPLSARSFICDHLRFAAITAGVSLEEGQRFGLHNLRHSLSNWLVNKAKVDPKTVQGILRHSRIQTTLDLYTQTDGEEMRIAQGRYLEALGLASRMVQ